MSSNPIQYCTLVSGGGTPVRIADQKGSPYPTTGYGALVFNINPTIEGGLIVNGDIVFTGDLQGPYNSPLTTQGDLYYYGPTGNTRLPVGAAGTTLTSDGNNAYWRVGGASPGGTAGGDLDGTYPNPTIKPSLTNGQVMTTVAGTAQWANLPAGNPGTVTTISVASANGLAGTVATPTSTPTITISTTVTGMLKGNGTAISAATAGTDYVIPSGLPTTLPPSGTAGGDLSSTYPNPLLKPSLTNGQVMTTVAGVAIWAAASGGGASLTISDTPPGSPTAGAMWWNSVLGTLMVYYNDGNSSQWVPATPTMAGSYLPLTGGTLTGPLTGTTAAFSGTVQTGNLNVVSGNLAFSDGYYGYTPYNGATNTGQVRAGIQYNGNLQTLSFYTANTWRGNVEASGLLNWAGAGTFTGALTGTTATFSGVVTSTNTTPPGASFRVDGAAATNRTMGATTAGAMRWSWGANTAAEGGSNAGSDFGINAYSDAGGFVATPIAIARATNAVTLIGPLTGTSGSFSGSVVSGVGSVGRSGLFQGDATHAGYMAIFDHNNARQGYIGFIEGGMNYNADVGVHTFQQTVMAPGAQIQMVSVETGAVATGTTIIPLDDTIPQITEGDQYMTLAITPKSATSKLVVEVTAAFANTVTNANIVAALFQDATANALAAVVISQSVPNGFNTITFRHVMTSGTTSATTFRVRAGGTVASTTTFNGNASARFMGGVMASSIVIREVAP
jgi:hypothetical protein